LRASLSEDADRACVEVEVYQVEGSHFASPQGPLEQQPDDGPITDALRISAPVEVCEQPAIAVGTATGRVAVGLCLDPPYVDRPADEAQRPRQLHERT